MTLHRSKLTVAGCGLLLLAAVGPAGAHHSFAMFEMGKTVAVDGVVQELQWTNPHSVLLLVGSPVAGEGPKLWSIEMTSPGNLTRMGWSKRSLKPGDRIKAEISPLRDGQPGGALKKVTITATGEVLVMGALGAVKPN